MKKKFLWVLSTFLLLFLAYCQTVPITGRQQLQLVPDQQVRSMAVDSYKEFLSENKVITGTPEAQMVKRVGDRIRIAVERYFTRNGMEQELKGYSWEFNLIEEDTVNAWCMPGGKVAVYTGILPVTKDDVGLAVVMGHEVAHAVAKHGNERMSQGLLAQLGGAALSVALANRPAETQQLFMTAYGLGAQVGILLPYSRLQESEADHLGLIFMSMAGYDPHAAVNFWQRMAAQKQGDAPPEFLSTHPADQTRIENIKRLIPEAMEHFDEARE